MSGFRIGTVVLAAASLVLLIVPAPSQRIE